MSLLIAGAAGQLGSVTVEEFGRDHDIVALTRAEVDLTDAAAIRRAVETARPDIVVNCAAYNDVDGAEDDGVNALKVNAFAVRALAQASAACGATFVHYSTDFVFDGHGSRPYVETDLPNPKSFYAASKLLGEWFARDAPVQYVLRVESLFGGTNPAGRQGSFDRIVEGIVEGREVPVFVDRTVTLSYVVDVARATRVLLEARAEPGLYHCANSGQCTWFELAEEVARQLGREPRLRAVKVAEVKFKAARPQFCALSNDKLASAGASMPVWQDAVRRHLVRKGLIG